MSHFLVLSRSYLQETKKNSASKIQTSEVEVDQRTWFIRIVSPLLFFAPDFYYRGLAVRGVCGNNTATIIGSDWLEILLFVSPSMQFCRLLVVNLKLDAHCRQPFYSSSMCHFWVSISSTLITHYLTGLLLKYPAMFLLCSA